jgi:transcriptional regulator with XRE-family HTH domain
MANLNLQEAFANRVRSLRLAANLSIEKASELGGLSSGFWGEVERNVKEPCLESLYGFARGLGITVSRLLAFDEQKIDSESRTRLRSLLDVFDDGELDFVYDVAQIAAQYRLSKRS